MNNPKPLAAAKNRTECLRTNKHLWNSTAGGYRCTRCFLSVSDMMISSARRDGMNIMLNDMLDELGKTSEHWIIDLHQWMNEHPEHYSYEISGQKIIVDEGTRRE